MHHARVEHSSRLQRVLDELLDGLEHSSLELAMGAGTVAPGTCVSELRANGYAIRCERRGKRWYYRLEEEAT